MWLCGLQIEWDESRLHGRVSSCRVEIGTVIKRDDQYVFRPDNGEWFTAGRCCKVENMLKKLNRHFDKSVRKPELYSHMAQEDK